MTKQELALEVIERLKKEYPDADCTLDYDNAWKLLVSVRLAAQCTDARVNVVVQDLYAKFPTVEALANADVADIEAIVRPCGLGKSKARDISACMKILHEQYHDNVPGDFDALLKLPGVGRKSANLIMGDVFGKPAIVTDTHCIRLSNRIGLVDNMKEPKKVEMALWKIIPPEEGNDLCHRLVNHGRDVCTARTKPYCDRCCLNDICEKKWCRQPGIIILYTYNQNNPYHYTHYPKENPHLCVSLTRACLKKAFCKMCVTICGIFCPDEGAVAGYGN